jgi:opacity protein-like surface antigen
MTRVACAVLVLLASARVAAADAPASIGAVSEAPGAPAAPAPAAVPATPAATAPAPAKPFSLEAGWGYYEVSHVGAAWHMTDRAALDLFGGYGFLGEGQKASLGLGFRHLVGKPLKAMPWGWDLKALYWTQSDSNYDWKMFSLVLGGYLVRDLNPRLALKLDAGVALSGALESTRKQDVEFGHPQRWNGSVCLEAVYRL